MQDDPTAKEWAVSYKQIGLLVLTFVLGLSCALLLMNMSAGSPTTFSTTELIGFVLSVILSGASTILAVAAIALGKTSEQAVIRRSDESIKLLNEVFVRTTEALQRIEASTGVTEKRIEDIISGRVGDLSHRIAELATKETGVLGKDVKQLEKEIRESILQSVKDQDMRSSFEKRQEERRKKAEEEEQKRNEYQKHHQTILNAFSNRDDLKVVKAMHGSVIKSGDDLFDGIFTGTGMRVGVSTFPPGVPSEHIKLFVGNAANELASGNVSQVYVVLMGCYDQQSFAEAFEQSTKSLKDTIRNKIALVNIHPDKADEEVAKITIPK